MNDWAKWALGILAFLICTAIVAVWRLVTGKANKVDVDEDIKNLRAEYTQRVTDANLKFDTLQAEGLRQYRELKASIEVIQKELTLLDKHSLTSQDLLEMKADIKEVIVGQREQVKLIDGMPERLTSLEATRNKQSER